MPSAELSASISQRQVRNCKQELTCCTIRRLPVDDRTRSSAIRQDSQVEEAANEGTNGNIGRVCLSESQSTVGIDVDLLTTRNLDL